MLCEYVELLSLSLEFLMVAGMHPSWLDFNLPFLITKPVLYPLQTNVIWWASNGGEDGERKETSKIQLDYRKGYTY